MSYITSPPRNSSRADRLNSPGRRHRADFARSAVFAEFGRHAWAIDQDDFEDRESWERPVRSPEARSAK